MKTCFTIGSDPRNDIVLKGKYIEPFHAQIEKIGDEYYLHDISEHFGVTINNDRLNGPTLLNGRRNVKISTHVLHWKEEIEDILRPAASPEADFYAKDFLSWKGTLDQKTYRFILLLVAVSPVLVFPGVHALLVLISWLSGLELVTYIRYVWSVCFLLIGYVLVVQSIRRARAIPVSPVWFVVPLYNLYLLLFK